MEEKHEAEVGRLQEDLVAAVLSETTNKAEITILQEQVYQLSSKLYSALKERTLPPPSKYIALHPANNRTQESSHIISELNESKTNGALEQNYHNIRTMDQTGEELLSEVGAA
jgi:hypothetical protein